MRRTVTILFLSALLWAGMAQGAVRLKDLGSIEGVRKNQLIGYGLVVGLNGTGDGSGTSFTNRSTVNMLERLGVSVEAGAISVKNVAAVIVTADLPPFARAGQRLDVLISSLGDAKSLHGGTLLLTPLRAPNGETFAIAQGPIAVGGYAAASQGAGTTVNHPTTARIAGGAILELNAPVPVFDEGYMDYLLRSPDFTTATRVAQSVNERFGEAMAMAIDAGRIRIRLPQVPDHLFVKFVSDLETLTVEPDQIARVVVDEKTGTVVMGKEVKIHPVALAHGSLTVRVTPYQDVSQPEPFSQGETVTTRTADVRVEEEDASLYTLDPGEDLSSLVDALNALGVSPRELVTIFQTLKAAGALEAELVIL